MGSRCELWRQITGSEVCAARREYTLIQRYGCPSESKSLALTKPEALGLPHSTLFIHSVFTMFVPYLHSRVRSHALSNAWPDAPSSDRRRKAWELLTRLESIHGLAALVNFVVFLWNGRCVHPSPLARISPESQARYRTLADRLLRLRLISARRHFQREVSYEFMNRQMVWHAFTVSVVATSSSWTALY